jgi:hypothetical protein
MYAGGGQELRFGAVARYGACGASIALVLGLLLLPWLLAQEPARAHWGLIGWSLTATVSLACGSLLTVLHGRQGTAFLKAYGLGMLVRLTAYGAGAAAAVAAGDRPAVLGYLAGWGAAYVPTQLFEMVWFARRTCRP